MKNVCLRLILTLVLGLIFVQPVMSTTTGKIAGIVKDQETGESLMGANVLIDGTSMGGAADMNGEYTILNVPPGTYSVTATVIGYARMTISNVRVRIDQTTRIDFSLAMEAVQGEAVQVVADANIIKEDVSSSVTAFSTDEVEELALSNINDVVELQAGVEDGLVIRGGEAGESLFQVDGITLRDPRNNQPISGIALSAIQEISIERGGFNAEYGQVRSGIINVVTKEGSKTEYHGSIQLKASPPAPKHFGVSPFDAGSMWMRPYLDDEVCWTGTDSWDEYTARQYPEFRGWNQVSRELLSDDDPSNNLSPAACQKLFNWEHRREPITDQPDYNIDAGFGGPIPIFGEYLGNLRFFTSYRREREMLLIPLTRDDYVDWDWSGQLTSDISSSTKLSFNAFIGKMYTIAINEGDEIFITNEFGPNDSRQYNYWHPTIFLRSPLEIAKVTSEQRPGRIFSDGWYCNSEVAHKALAMKMTHTLNNKTFFESSLEYVGRQYTTGPIDQRDPALIEEIVPGYWVDEAPYGWSPSSQGGIGGAIKFFGGHTGEARDSSRIASTTFKFDLTSQIDFNNLVKTGIEIVYNDLNLYYGDINNFTGRVVMVQERKFPIRGAFYIQDKLETKGFILNMGLRLDYSNANTPWILPVDPFDKTFFSSQYDPGTEYEEAEVEAELTVSPRLGISHPITENSKLYFNYGHFKQLPTYEEMLRVGRSAGGSMSNYGDPNLALAKTISYELGYDHVLFGNVLIQAAAFYHDIRDQQAFTVYASADGSVIYSLANNNSYEDIRGFELNIQKQAGWISGFANYTYQVNTYGYFGTQRIFQNTSEQRQYNENTRLLYQGKPLPQPFARASLVFHAPKDFGPELLGVNPLEDWTLNFILNWKAGEYITWNPFSRLDIFDNIQVKNYYNMSMRLTKTFPIKNDFKLTVFLEVENLLNTKRLSGGSFYDNFDYLDYMNSLHLPESEDWDNIAGDDKPGDYRNDDIAFQPIEQIGATMDMTAGKDGVIYYDISTGKYMNYVDGAWSEVDSGTMDKVLDEKAYIDNPNQTSFNFLNPRQWFVGVRISF